MRQHAAVRSATIAFANLLAGGAIALAQTMPGIETKKVKTIPIHRNGSFGQAVTPSVRSPSTATPLALDVPMVKVPTIRVKPTGEMTYPPPRDPAPADKK